jgi:hypothetical protein
LGKQTEKNFWVDYYRFQKELLASPERIYKIKAIKNLKEFGVLLVRAFKILERANLERDFLKDFIIKLNNDICTTSEKI